MSKIIKFTAILLCLLLPTALADGADITIGYVSGAGAMINPFLCSERDMISINSLVYESLFELDASGKPQPVLAENWTREGKIWTIYLRNGVTCHNGIELVAQDVVDSFNTMRTAGADTPYYGRLALITSMSVSDVFVITVEAACEGDIALYAMTFPVAQRSTLSNNTPMGTGAYWFISYESGVGARLEKNPLWWRKAPLIESIDFTHYWDTAGALTALQSGDIDMFQTRATSAAVTKKLSYASSMDFTTNVYELLIPNMAGYMGDVRVRKAIMYAIDYNTLITHGYLDMAQQCEVPLQPGSWLYESRSAVYYYSPERAVQLLAEAGWTDLTGDFWLNRVEDGMLKVLEFEILVYNDQSSHVRENVAEMICANLRAIGVKATVKLETKSDALYMINHDDFTLALVALNLSDVPNLVPLLSEAGNCNLSGVFSAEWDALLTATATANTDDAMTRAYSEIQLKIVDELPFMGLCFRTGMLLSTRPLTGVSPLRETDAFSGMEFEIK